MKRFERILSGTVILIGCLSQTWAIKPTAEEMAASKEWMQANLSSQFSFQYGGRTSADLLKTWERNQSQEKLDGNRTRHTLTFTDPDTGLEVRAEAIAFSDFPALEWVLYFKNRGSTDTPIVEKILPLDARNPVSEEDTPLLRYALGATSRLEDFAPRERTLEENAYIQLQPQGGRPSSEYLPFFNIDSGRKGIMLAIGWTGEWSATFSRGKDDQVRMQAGSQSASPLHPGSSPASRRWGAPGTAHFSQCMGQCNRKPAFEDHRSDHPTGSAHRILLDRCGLVWRGTLVAQSRKLEREQGFLSAGIQTDQRPLASIGS